MKKLCLILLCMMLNACTDEPIVYDQLRYGDMTGDIRTGHQSNPIRLRCGTQCRTIPWEPINFSAAKNTLTKKQAALIRSFLKQQNHHQTVYIAPCDGIPLPAHGTKRFASLIAQNIQAQGYTVWITQPVFSAKPYYPKPLCANLVRKPITPLIPQCPNLHVLDSVYHSASDFGCTQARALASMISDPWDLIVAPDQEGPTASARVLLANQRYNEGKRVQFKSNTSNGTLATPTAAQDY
jgi:type IV pilus biogenesis protein CpaD/CtpE